MGGYKVVLESKRSSRACRWAGGSWPWLVSSPGKYGRGREGRLHPGRIGVQRSRRTTFVARRPACAAYKGNAWSCPGVQLQAPFNRGPSAATSPVAKSWLGHSAQPRHRRPGRRDPGQERQPAAGARQYRHHHAHLWLCAARSGQAGRNHQRIDRPPVAA